MICDDGAPRNAASRQLHGFLTRDCTPPLELLRLAREELRPYGIRTRTGTVTAIGRSAEGFAVTLDDGHTVSASTVLIASGVRDHVPDLPGFVDCYGISVHHCPYCDGWEVRDRHLVVFGRGRAAAGLALSLKTWSAHVTICSHGRARIARPDREKLAGERIAVSEERILNLEHRDGHARLVRLETGGAIPCEALFFTTGQSPRCDLPRQLGCAVTKRGIVKTDHLGQTRVPGLYVAGDASKDVQFAIVAAAEGAKAGVAINKALQARAGLAVASVA